MYYFSFLFDFYFCLFFTQQCAIYIYICISVAEWGCACVLVQNDAQWQSEIIEINGLFLGLYFSHGEAEKINVIYEAHVISIPI